MTDRRSSSTHPRGPSGVPFADVSPRAGRGRTARAAAAVLALAVFALPVGAGAETTPAPTPAPADAKPPTAVLKDTRFDNGVVAVVDGDPITLRELKQYGVKSAPFLPPEVRNDYRELLDTMIEQRLLRYEYEKNGIVASDEMVDRYIAGILQESHQSRQQLELDIAKAGLTWKEYFERMREEVQRIQLVSLLIRSRVNVPQEEVREVWENDPTFLESEKLVIAAILVPSPTTGEDGERGRQKALEVHLEAKKDFEDAAKEHSKLPGASEGGTLGEFTRGSLAPHLEDALEGLDEGDVSEPVPGAGGWWIVKLVDVKSAGRVPFEEVQEQLADKLYEERMQERYRKWVNEDLRKDHRVDNMLDRLAVIAAQSTAAPQ